MFFKIGVLKNFVNFTEKHLCWSLFKTFFTELLQWLLLVLTMKNKVNNKVGNQDDVA